MTKLLAQCVYDLTPSGGSRGLVVFLILDTCYLGLRGSVCYLEFGTSRLGALVTSICSASEQIDELLAIEDEVAEVGPGFGGLRIGAVGGGHGVEHRLGPGLLGFGCRAGKGGEVDLVDAFFGT